MLKNSFVIALRNFRRNRISSVINIGGLAVGMAVAMLIGLWIWDELSYNKYFEKHDRIAQVMTNAAYNGGTNTDYNTAPPYGPELRRLYGGLFKHVLMTSRPNTLMLSSGEKALMKTGYYFEPGIADMLSLKMLKGTHAGLNDPASILLSSSVAKAYYGDADPVGKHMTLDNDQQVTVTGVYADIPYNTDFADMGFISSWQLFVSTRNWVRKDNWEQDGYQTYVELADNVDMQKASAAIRDLKRNAIDKAVAASAKPVVFLLPMNDFHLYSDYDNGVVVGRPAHYVWLYGIIGFSVLLLACINFMNLATARSEKRAKEVGIRKAIGSLRRQLIGQFMSESLLNVAIAFVLSLVLVQVSMPFFNEVADKQMVMMWGNVWFWIVSVFFVLITGFVAGSYPALYLSSFRPVKVLKGSWRAGFWAAVPRKVLVVLQFSVSIVLAIGVIVVFRQIQLGKDRPVGYQREGLVSLTTPTSDIHDHLEAFRSDCKKTGAVVELAESITPVTGLGFATNGLEWAGRGPDPSFWIGKAYVGAEYGRTIGWQVVEGRDFTGSWKSDSATMILNETVVRYMGLKHPVGTIVKETLFGKTTAYTVVGVVKDILQQSPYRSVKETIYIADNERTFRLTVRVAPGMGMHKALALIEPVFHKYAPGSPFEYRFVDVEYAKKFGEEERVSKLAGFFAVLAIFISCLGLFGMASFMAERRTREIGVRKVLGASVFSLWRLLSREFVILVTLSLLIATPFAYYFMHGWLQQFQMRTSLSWWIFGAAGVGALAVSLVTVSWQAVRAAVANPVKSLRTE